VGVVEGDSVVKKRRKEKKKKNTRFDPDRFFFVLLEISPV
jgi:hypothetical protein